MRRSRMRWLVRYDAILVYRCIQSAFFLMQRCIYLRFFTCNDCNQTGPALNCFGMLRSWFVLWWLNVDFLSVLTEASLVLKGAIWCFIFFKDWLYFCIRTFGNASEHAIFSKPLQNHIQSQSFKIIGFLDSGFALKLSIWNYRFIGLIVSPPVHSRSVSCSGWAIRASFFF